MAANTKSLGRWTHLWFASATASAVRCEPLLTDLAGPNHGALDVELMGFINSLNNVRRGARAALGHGSEPVRRFDAAVPDLKAIRDQLEHFDDYVEGRGRLQADAEPDSDHFWTIGQTGGLRLEGHHTAITARFQIIWSPTKMYEVDLVRSLMAALDLVSEVLLTSGINSGSTSIMDSARDWGKRHLR